MRCPSQKLPRPFIPLARFTTQSPLNTLSFPPFSAKPSKNGDSYNYLTSSRLYHPMQKDESHDAGASGVPASPSSHDASSGGFQPGAKLREKLQELAEWRIDRSSIEFPKDAPEFRGGNATVLKAVLVSPSGDEDRKDQSDNIGNKSLASESPEGEPPRRLKPVAVKKMNISGDRARVLGLTLREADFLVDLSHENVIELEGFVEDLSNDIVWLVFPWEDNGTLRDFIASADWEIPERISLIDDVARGVEYLHSRQPPIRHGDLKSINILVNTKCRAVITDFGSARRLTTEDVDKEKRPADNKPQATLSLEATFCSSTNTMGITLTGDKYTLRWAPPEVLREEEPGLESDIWALGWVAYEVMTNSIPFQDVAKDAIIIRRVIQGDLPSITDHARMSLIQALCSLMLACWSIDPTKRPAAEDCRNSIHWMPMIIPDPIRGKDAAASRARSPALLMKLGEMYRRQSDYSNALDCFTNALGSYRDLGDSKGKAAALRQLAQVHRFQGENSQAAAYYSDALQIYTEMGESRGRALALSGLAEVHRLQEKNSQAITFYSESLQIRTENGDQKGRAYALVGLADVHLAQNEYNQAITFYSEALQIRTDIGDSRGRANVLSGLAEAYRLQNEYSKAITLILEALEIFTIIGSRYGRAHSLADLADVHRDQGNYPDAISRYKEALEIFQQIGDAENAAHASNEAAKAHRLWQPKQAMA